MSRSPVEVFYAPRNEYTDARAAEIEAGSIRELEALPTQALQRLVRTGELILAERQAFERFQHRAGV